MSDDWRNKGPEIERERRILALMVERYQDWDEMRLREALLERLPLNEFDHFGVNVMSREERAHLMGELDYTGRPTCAQDREI